MQMFLHVYIYGNSWGDVLVAWLFEDDTGVLAAVMKIHEYALVMCCLVT